MIVHRRPPSRSRLKVFANRRHSYLRSLEYELLGGIELKGRVLDLGGGKRADYANRLRVDGVIDSINLDPSIEPTILHDANQPFPINDATYDAIISFNTLEHIKRDEFALSELVRVLKPKGAFHIIAPFLFRVHAAPLDYHRHTAYWWQEILLEFGIPTQNTRIEPIIWGRLTTALSFLQFSLLRRVPLWSDLIRRGLRDEEYPLGYYISGTKP